MKTIKYYILLCVALSGLISSCNDDDIYMENPDKRIQAKMQEYTDILAGSSNGWIVEINTQLGGIHTLWMQFTKDNRVSMMFDYVEYYRDLKSTTFESSYALKALQRPTLSFDTYSFISIFADPNQLMNGAGKPGTGLIADYEYEIISYKNDQFIMKGRKNGMSATFTKATQQQYDAVQSGSLMENQDQAPIYRPGFYSFVYKNQQYDFVSNGRNTGFLSLDRSGEPEMQLHGSKIDFNGNIIMMEPLVLGDYEIPHFTKTENGYTAKLGNDLIEIKPSTTPAVQLLYYPPQGVYQHLVVYNSMQNQWSSEYFDKHKAAVSTLFSWSKNLYYITYVAVHLYSDGVILEIGYQMYQNGSLGSDTYGAFYTFEYKKNPNGSFTFGNYDPWDTINPGHEEFDKCLSSILEGYFKGHTYFFKTWPALYNNRYIMSAMIPADDKSLGVMVGVPMNL